MFWFNILKSFIGIFREGQTPAQVAGGFALGSLIGFSPMLTLQGVAIWAVILVLDVNIAAALLAMTLCKLVAYLIDPVFHALGYYLLVNVGFLHGFWTGLYNAPIAPLTRFYNTVVMGSFVFAALCFVPIYIGMKRAVVAYRTHVSAHLKKWKVYQALDKSKFVNTYRRVRDWRG